MLSNTAKFQRRILEREADDGAKLHGHKLSRFTQDANQVYISRAQCKYCSADAMTDALALSGDSEIDGEVFRTECEGGS